MWHREGVWDLADVEKVECFTYVGMFRTQPRISADHYSGQIIGSKSGSSDIHAICMFHVDQLSNET